MNFNRKCQGGDGLKIKSGQSTGNSSRLAKSQYERAQPKECLEPRGVFPRKKGEHRTFAQLGHIHLIFEGISYQEKRTVPSTFRGGSPLSALRGRFGVTLLLGGFANGCDKTHWHGCARQRSSDAAGLLASGLAAGGC